jgi:hypothetical protein
MISNLLGEQQMNNQKRQGWPSRCVLILCFLLAFFAQTESQESLYNHRPNSEPPFEKIYVQPYQLVSMPDGLYYYEDSKCPLKVNAVLQDEEGMYIIMVKYQCPLCGRSYRNKYPDDEHACPLFMKAVMPNIWSK